MSRKEQILILGGTHFIGRHLIEQLLGTDQYHITLLNRGKTNTSLFPELPRIYADRNSVRVRKAVQGKWDYIIDLSCYFPRGLELVLKGLSHPPRKYLFVSTCSVYDPSQQLILRDETSKLSMGDEADLKSDDPKSYGYRKAECERLLHNSGLNYSIFRPALVYGPYDTTDRLYYWLYQVKHHQRILLPNNGNQRFSTTYVLDLVQTIVQSIQEGSDREIYNVISTPETSIAKIVDSASDLLGQAPVRISASSDFLHKHQVAQWSGLALWLDSDFYTYSNQKLLDKFGPFSGNLKSNLRTTLNWYDSLRWPEPQFGINRNEQLKLLEKCLPS